MAVDFEGFSIREYALKMRSVDSGKCWPFGGGGVEGRRFLPDMPIRKFRWWADELHAKRTDSETPELACGGEREDGASAASEIWSQAKVCSPSRMKQRTPKKRSIAELFAVSPPMNAGKIKTDRSGEDPQDQKEEDDSQDTPQENQISKGRKKKIKSNNKIGIKKKTMKKKKEKKREMKKDKKDKTCELRKLSAVNLSKVNKRLHNAEYDSAHTFLLSQVKNARLKEQKRLISAKKGKTKSIIKGSDPTEICYEHNKQLSFPGKDGKVVRKERSTKLGLPNLRRLCKIISDVLAASSTNDDSDKHICDTEADQLVNFHDKEVITRNIETGEASSEGNQVNDTCEVIVGMRSGGTKKTHLSRSLDLNYPVQNCVDLACFSFGNSSFTPSSEMYESDQKVPDPMNKAVASVGCENVGKESASFMPDFGKRIDNAMNVTNNLYQIQPAYHISPQDIVSSTCPSSLEGRRIPRDLATFCKGKSIGEGFVGLPLDSQGALMQLHPNTGLDFGDLSMRSNPAPDCLRLLSPSCHIELHTEEQGEYIQLHRNDPQNWFTKQYFPGENILTSDFGSSGFHDLGKFNAKTHNAQSQFIDRDFRKMEISYNGRKNGSSDQNCFDKMKFHPPSSQRSMRLMGKNVIIGRTSKDSKDNYDSNVWKDKNIINQKIPTMNVYKGHIMNRYPQEECILRPDWLPSREVLSSPLEAQSMCPSAPLNGKTSDYIHFNTVPQWMSKNGNYSATNYQGLHMGPSSFHVPPQNFRTDFGINRNSASSFIDLEQARPVWAFYPENMSGNMLLNSIPCKRGSQTGNSIQSSFNQPLHDQVSWSFGQAGTVHSSQKVPYWLLNPINQHPLISNQPVNVQPSQIPVAVFPCNINRISQTCGFSVPPSSVYNSSFAAMPASRFSSIKPCEKTVELNFNHVNMQEHHRNSRKRHLLQNDMVMEAVKRRYLNVHKEPLVFTESARSEQWKDMEKNKRVHRSSIIQPSHPVMQKDKNDNAASLELCALTANCEGSGITFNAGIKHTDFLKTSYAQTTSGPVKLSAGAKHILRPNQSIDQDNARPVHSSIPFVQGANIDDDSTIQTATKVYRF